MIKKSISSVVILNRESGSFIALL